MRKSKNYVFMNVNEASVADLHSKILDAPRRVQILSFSCSFWENLAKSYVGAPLESWRPHLGEILDPPLSLLVHMLSTC